MCSHHKSCRISFSIFIALLFSVYACSGNDALPPHPPPEFGPYSLQHVPQEPAKEAVAPQEPAIATNPGATLSGTIKMSDALKAQVKEGKKLLFVVVKAPEGRMPLAVQKLTVEQFPVEFNIGESDAMVPGTKLMGPLLVSARLDADGAAGPASPGDLEGTSKRSVALGDRHIEIIIDKKY